MKASEYEILLKEMEVRLERVRALYEQYFMGLERIAPEKQRDEFDRALKILRREQPRNTALRFRTQNLVQRYITLNTHWTRVVRQIEEGTYKRDVQRAQRRRAQAPAADRAGPKAYELDLDVDLDVDSLFGSDDVDAALGSLEMDPAAVRAKVVIDPKKSAPPPAPASFGRPAQVRAPTVARAAAAPVTGARPAPPPGPAATGAGPKPLPARPAPSGEMDDAQLRKLYDRYIEARRRNNERVDNVKFETLKKSIDQMTPKLQQKHKGKKIDFEVVVKDGRVGLKPVPKS